MDKASYPTTSDLPRSGGQQSDAKVAARQSPGDGSTLQHDSEKGAAQPLKENIYANLIAKDQIQLWLPMLASTLQRPRTEGRKPRRKKSSNGRVVDSQPGSRFTAEATGGLRFKGHSRSNREAAGRAQPRKPRQAGPLISAQPSEASAARARGITVDYSKLHIGEQSKSFGLVTSKLRHFKHEQEMQEQSYALRMIMQHTSSPTKTAGYGSSVMPTLKGSVLPSVGVLREESSTEGGKKGGRGTRSQSDAGAPGGDTSLRTSILSNEVADSETHSPVGSFADHRLFCALREQDRPQRGVPVALLPSDGLLPRRKHTKHEKSLYAPVDFDKYREDIEKRRRMKVLLERQKQEMLTRLKHTTRLKNQSLAALKYQSRSYHAGILGSIVRIQRWWRGERTKRVLGGAAREKRAEVRAELGRKLRAMEDSVQILRRELEKRQAAQQESGTRDRAAEKQDMIKRAQAATKKAQAVVKFENVMSQMFFRNLAQATIHVFQDVKEPLFDHIDQSPAQREETPSAGRGASDQSPPASPQANSFKQPLTPSNQEASNAQTTSPLRRGQTEGLFGAHTAADRAKTFADSSWQIHAIDIDGKGNGDDRSATPPTPISGGGSSARTQRGATPSSPAGASPPSLLRAPSAPAGTPPGNLKGRRSSPAGGSSPAQRLSRVGGIKRVQIASRSGAPDGPLDTIKEGEKGGDADGSGLRAASLQDPDTPFFFARQKTTIGGTMPNQLQHAAKKDKDRKKSTLLSSAGALSLVKRLSGSVGPKAGDAKRRKSTALSSSVPGALLRADAQAEGQRKGGTGTGSSGRGGAGKGASHAGGLGEGSAGPNMRAYTKLNLAQVKEDGGELGREGRRNSSGFGSSASQTESDGRVGRFEEGRSAAQTERQPTTDGSRVFATDQTEREVERKDSMRGLLRKPFKKHRKRGSAGDPFRREQFSTDEEEGRVPQTVRSGTDASQSFTYGEVSTGAVESQVRSKARWAFAEEQSQLKKDPPTGFNVPDLSHGSRTPRGQRVKTITPEQRQFVRDLVATHSKRPQAFAQTLSTPFKRAYPALNDFIGLYDSRGNKHNPAVKAYKDEIAARIRRFYLEREARQATYGHFACMETLRVAAPSPHKLGREATRPGAGASGRSLAGADGGHDDGKSSAAISTMSQVIARKQDVDQESSGRGSIYGPYREVQTKHADPQRLIHEVIQVERKLRASKAAEALSKERQELVEKVGREKLARAEKKAAKRRKKEEAKRKAREERKAEKAELGELNSGTSSFRTDSSLRSGEALDAAEPGRDGSKEGSLAIAASSDDGDTSSLPDAPEVGRDIQYSARPGVPQLQSDVGNFLRKAAQPEERASSSGGVSKLPWWDRYMK